MAAIFAVPFDPKALTVLGTPVPVQDDVAWIATDGLGGYSVASERNAGLSPRLRLEREQARRLGRPRRDASSPRFPQPGAFAEPRLSPDGRWIVVTVTEPEARALAV